ncbi:hypothetical protein [Pseudoalteromonas sp. ASV78]|uniref:hypothetical protein n=1 Tax=Pseudoalteromonas sp. ASV78 TaxID=3397851 RepID=UPI0039FC65B4
MPFLSITELNKALLGQLKTEKERAKYLLQFEITVRLTSENYQTILKAKIGDIDLPITGNDESSVITAARIFLQQQAA